MNEAKLKRRHSRSMEDVSFCIETLAIERPRQQEIGSADWRQTDAGARQGHWQGTNGSPENGRQRPSDYPYRPIRHVDPASASVRETRASKTACYGSRRPLMKSTSVADIQPLSSHFLSQSVPHGHREEFKSAQTRAISPRPFIRREMVIEDDGIADSEGDLGAPECSLCMEEYMDEGARVPRNLQCGHTFCTGCLQGVFSTQAHDADLPCPVCFETTPLSIKGVEGLAKNFGLLELIPGIVASSAPVTRERSPLRSTLRLKRGRGGGGGGGGGEEGALLCPEHGDHLSSYCVKDDKLVCSSCLLYGMHKHHHCLLVPQAAQDKREELSRLNPEVLKQRQKMEESLAQVEKERVVIEEAESQLLAEVEQQFDDLEYTLRRRRDELKLEIRHRSQTRTEVLMVQARDLHECAEKASTAYHNCTNLIGGDDFSLLQGSSFALTLVEGVFINPPPFEPRARADLRFDLSSEIKDDIVSNVAVLGKVHSEPGTIRYLHAQPYHDGVRISWEGHDLADNHCISYHLQMAAEGTDAANYVMLYRGGNTKYTWKTGLEDRVSYRFRVQVRTTEGVGQWSNSVQVVRKAPMFLWHDNWCNIRIELSADKLEAKWTRGSAHKHWATFAGSLSLQHGLHYFEIELLKLGQPRPNKSLAIGIIGVAPADVSSVPWQDGRQAIGQWQEHTSWAFFPISGNINSKTLPPEGRHYADVKLQEGDRIGVLVDMDEHLVSFFCNGQDLGVAFEGIEAESVLPAVSIRDKLHVRLRFPPPPFTKRTPRCILLSSTSSTN